jgi:hypothetical protein
VSTSKTISGFVEKKSGARLGTAIPSSPIAPCLLAPWWQSSALRILAEEICNFPRRILAIRRRPHLRFGYTLPTYPTFDGRESQGQGYKFALACNADIQRLRQDNPWAGRLDLEMAAEAYQAGADWAIHNICSCKEKGSTV